MGRPKLAKSVKKVHIMWPSKEYRELKREAAKKGISFSELVRRRCRGR